MMRRRATVAVALVLCIRCQTHDAPDLTQLPNAVRLACCTNNCSLCRDLLSAIHCRRGTPRSRYFVRHGMPSVRSANMGQRMSPHATKQQICCHLGTQSCMCRVPCEMWQQARTEVASRVTEVNRVWFASAAPELEHWTRRSSKVTPTQANGREQHEAACTLERSRDTGQCAHAAAAMLDHPHLATTIQGHRVESCLSFCLMLRVLKQKTPRLRKSARAGMLAPADLTRGLPLSLAIAAFCGHA